MRVSWTKLCLAFAVAYSVMALGCSGNPDVLSGAKGDANASDVPGASGSGGGGGSGIVISIDANFENRDVPVVTTTDGDNTVDVVKSVCGNGIVEDGESCDDGNARGGDGCDGTCKIENGYTCPTPGKPCVSLLYCGDGLPGPDESCDDGNAVSGDGCSSTCTVENGYVCPAFGQPCTPTTQPPVCGNGVPEFGETCDDGNTTSGDGCSSTCQTESGYTCIGKVCTLNQTCGNGVWIQVSNAMTAI